MAADGAAAGAGAMKRSGTGFDFGGAVKAKRAAATTLSGAAAASGDGPKLIHLHAFGARGGITDPVEFLSETSVVHFVGQHLALYNLERQRMQFFTKNKHVKSVLAMAVAPNLKAVALCERLSAEGEKAQVSVYHVATRRKMRSMQFSMRGDFRKVCFSGDSKFLATFGGSPEAHIVYWKWNGEKAVANVKAPSAISRIRFNPHDASMITTSGNGHLRMWKLTTEQGLRDHVIVSGKREQDNFVDHVWLKEKRVEGQVATERRMVAITDAGQVLVFDKTTDEDNPSLEVKLHIQATVNAMTRVETVVAYNKGFCLGGANGFLEVYERTEDPKDPFYRLNTFQGGDDSVVHMAVSPNDETLVAYGKTRMLQVFPLSNIDIIAKDKHHLEPLVPNGVHTKGVVDMDICLQRPLVVTVSADRDLRVWNYLSWQCQVVEELPDEPTGVAYHPSGWLLLVGFKEKIRMYNMLMKGIRMYHEVAQKQCHALTFSNGGQFFAAGAGIKVIVYDTYAFKEVATFDGHVSIPVRHLRWSADDSLLCSCGEDGAVYTFSMATGKRLEELSFVHKQAKYTSVVIDDAKGTVLAAGSDGNMRVTTRDTEEESFSAGDTVITALALSPDNTRLYAGTLSGAVRVYPWPLPGIGTHKESGGGGEMKKGEGKGDDGEGKKAADVDGGGGGGSTGGGGGSSGSGGGGGGGGGGGAETGSGRRPMPGGGGGGQPNTAPALATVLDFVEYPLHVGPVTALLVSRDSKYMLSCSQDGSVFAMGIPNAAAAGKPASRGGIAGWEPSLKKQFNLDVTLVFREEFEDALQDLALMQKKLSDQESDFRYKLTLKESEWGEARAKLQEQMDEALSQERARYEALQQRHESYVRDHMEERERVEADHVRVTQEVENQYEHKLALEMERYDALCEQVESMRQECEALLEAAEKAHDSQVRDLKASHAARETELSSQIDTLHENLATNQKEYEIILKDVDQEHEAEFLRKVAAHERRLAEEAKLTASKQNQLTLQTNRTDALKKKLAELKHQIAVKDDALKDAHHRNLQLEELLDHCARNLEEQRESIQDKEKQILNLRAGNRTLDNFRYVLDHRIAQLTQERGPIMGHVDSLEGHIREMYDELVREFAEKKAADRAMNNKDLKIEGLANEVAKLRTGIREKERFILAFQGDVERLVKATASKDVEAAAKDLYRTYVKQETGGKKGGHGSGRGLSLDAPAKAKDDSGAGDGGGGGGGGAGSGSSAPAGGAMAAIKAGGAAATAGADSASASGASGASSGAAGAGGGGGGVGGGGGGGGGVGGGGVGGGEDVEAVDEVVRQREYMHRFAMGLKRKLRNKGDAMERNTRNRLAENTTLINECNDLRRTTRDQALKIKELQTRLYLLQRDKMMEGDETVLDMPLEGMGEPDSVSRATTASTMNARQRKKAFGGRTDTMGARAAEEFSKDAEAKKVEMREYNEKKAASLRRINSTSSTPGATRRMGGKHAASAPGLGGSTPGLWATAGADSVGTPSSAAVGIGGDRPTSRARSSGRIVRGSTRPLEEISAVRGKMGGLLGQIDQNNRDMDAQRREIRRLREQVHLLLGQSKGPGSGGGGSGAGASAGSHGPSESVLGASMGKSGLPGAMGPTPASTTFPSPSGTAAAGGGDFSEVPSGQLRPISGGKRSSRSAGGRPPSQGQVRRGNSSHGRRPGSQGSARAGSRAGSAGSGRSRGAVGDAGSEADIGGVAGEAVSPGPGDRGQSGMFPATEG